MKENEEKKKEKNITGGKERYGEMEEKWRIKERNKERESGRESKVKGRKVVLLLLLHYEYSL